MQYIDNSYAKGIISKKRTKTRYSRSETMDMIQVAHRLKENI
jgi:hypothetical protein